MKIIGYARVSTKEQKYDAQVEKIQRFAKTEKHELLEIIKEKVSSIDNRPGFNRLMEMASKNKFEAVVVTKLDRFGRSVKDLLVSIDKFEKLSIEFISLGDNIDTTTPTGRLLFQLLAVISEFERSLIMERMKEGRERAIAKGTICNRPKIEIPEDELKKYYERLKSMSACAKLYEVSKGTIFNRLHELGVDTSK